MALSVRVQLRATLVGRLLRLRWVQDLVCEVRRAIILGSVALRSIYFVVDRREVLLADFDMIWRLYLGLILEQLELAVI